MTVSSKKVKAVLKIGLTLGLLVVVMLASVGAWEIYRGSAGFVRAAAADSGLSPYFTCYSVKQDSFPYKKNHNPGKLVAMDPIFPDGVRLKLKEATLFCVAAKILMD